VWFTGLIESYATEAAKTKVCAIRLQLEDNHNFPPLMIANLKSLDVHGKSSKEHRHEQESKDPPMSEMPQTSQIVFIHFVQ
jgi:hypothetical protein